MKKLLCVIVVLMICSLSIFSVSVAENQYDLQNMTEEELLALRNAINAELVDRGFEKEVTVPAGSYTVGTDIPEGSYTISTDSMLVMFTVYEKNGMLGAMHNIMPGQNIGKITLIEGQRVDITAGSVIFAPFTGLGF